MSGKNKAIIYIAALLVLGLAASQLGITYGLKNPKIPNVYAPRPQEKHPADRMIKVLKPDRETIIDGVIIVKKNMAKPVNAFVMQDDAGNRLNSSTFKGKVTQLFFWGIHSRPAVREYAEIAGAAQKYGPQGYAAYGIATKTTREEFAAFQKEHGAAFPSWLLDGDSPVPIFFAPSSVFIDKDGLVRIYIPEQIDTATRNKLIEYLLGEASSQPVAAPAAPAAPQR